jgi:hypothetical protein
MEGEGIRAEHRQAMRLARFQPPRKYSIIRASE